MTHEDYDIGSCTCRFLLPSQALCGKIENLSRMKCWAQLDALVTCFPGVPFFQHLSFRRSEDFWPSTRSAGHVLWAELGRACDAQSLWLPEELRIALATTYYVSVLGPRYL